MPDEMATVTFDIPARDALHLLTIVDNWVCSEALSDIAYARWRDTVAAIEVAVERALQGTQAPGGER